MRPTLVGVLLVAVAGSSAHAQTKRAGCLNTAARIQTACSRAVAGRFAPGGSDYRSAILLCEIASNGARNSCSASVSPSPSTACGNSCDDAFFYCGESCANASARQGQFSGYSSCVTSCSIQRSQCGNSCDAREPPPPRPAPVQPQLTPPPPRAYAPPLAAPQPAPVAAPAPVPQPQPQYAPPPIAPAPAPAYAPPPPQPAYTPPPQPYYAPPPAAPVAVPAAPAPTGGAPTLEATTAFLERFVPSVAAWQPFWSNGITGIAAKGQVVEGLNTISIRGCRLVAELRRFRCDPMHNITQCYTAVGSDSREWQPMGPLTIEGSLAGFDPARVTHQVSGFGGSVNVAIGANAARSPVYANGVQLRKVFVIFTKTLSDAERVANAFKHAISLCGGASDPF